VAEDVKFTYDRFRAEPANPLRFTLESVERIEVVDRYTVKFFLKEPFVWLLNVLANPYSTWIIASEVVQQFGDLKKPESVIGTGPFLLERYEPIRNGGYGAWQGHRITHAVHSCTTWPM